MHEPYLITVAAFALARRRRNRKDQVSHQYLLTHPTSGKKIPLNAPKGTFHPKDLIAALESVLDSGFGVGGDELAVYKLVEPYRLDGSNPRPDVLKCVFQAMALIFHPIAIGKHPAFLAELNRHYIKVLIRSLPSQ